MVRKPLLPNSFNLRSSPWFITTVVGMAVFTDVLFYGLIIPFTPVILKERLQVQEADIQFWNSALLAIFAAANVAASPICGYIADHTKSRQYPLLVGLFSMACATGMLHVGNTIGIFMTARVCQGVAAAILYSAGLALLYDSVGKENLGQAMGYITLSITAGAFLGPSLGGILYDVGQETAVFGLAYGVLLVDVILRFSVIEKDSGKDAMPAATPGYGTMGTRPTDSVEASEPITNAGSKMSTIRLLQSPRLLTALFGWFVVGTLLSAFDGVLPIFVQNTFGWSSAGAGFIFLPLFIPNLAGPLYGRMVDSSRHGGRVVATTGFLLCVPFFVLLRFVAQESAPTQVLLGGLLFMIGLGLALCGPPLFVEVAKTVSTMEDEFPGAFGNKGPMAQAYALYNCAFAIGQLVGPMWAWAAKSTLGWATLTWMFGLASGLTSIITGLFLGGWIGSALRSKEPPRENEH